MKDDRGELDLTKRIEELENSLSIALSINDKFQRENKDKSELISQLRQRVNELLAINKSHQNLMGRQIQENEELKKDNKALAKQIDDYFNVRMTNTRNSGKVALQINLKAMPLVMLKYILRRVVI